MSKIIADPTGTPTEQLRARHGWHLAGPGEVRCDACCRVDWLSSRTGVRCNRGQYATRVTATCTWAALPSDTAQAGLIRECAKIERIPTHLRTPEDRAALTAMYTDLGLADLACHDGSIPGDDHE